MIVLVKGRPEELLIHHGNGNCKNLNSGAAQNNDKNGCMHWKGESEDSGHHKNSFSTDCYTSCPYPCQSQTCS